MKTSKQRNVTYMAACITLAALNSAAQKTEGGIIKGLLTNSSQTTIYLSKDVDIPNKDKIPIDSASIINGQFSFHIKDSNPSRYSIFIKGQKRFLALFSDNDVITIKGQADTINKAEIFGSKQMDILKVFHQRTAADESICNYYFDKTIAFDKVGNRDSVIYYKSKLDSSKVILHKKIRDLYFQYPKSYATIRYLAAYDRVILPDSLALKILQDMPERYKTLNMYIDLKTVILARTTFAAGKPFKNFQLPDENNTLISSRDHENYLIVDFWASWCVPCRHENPVLKKIYDRYKSRGLKIISVSVDSSPLSWKKAIKEDGLDWTQVIATEGPKNPEIAALAINAIPHLYIIDHNGIIVAENLRDKELEEKLASLYK